MAATEETKLDPAPKLAPDPDPVPTESDPPIHSGLGRLARSSKAIVCGLAIAGVIVMNVLGKIDGPTALNAVLVLVGLLVGAVAIEDGAEKFSGQIRGAESPLVRLAPMLTEIVKAFAPDVTVSRTVTAQPAANSNVVPFPPPSHSPPDKSS